MRFINDKIHGALDYAVAIMLIVIPFALHFHAISSFSHWFSLVAGIGLFAYSLITGYSFSARAIISFKLHLVLDFIAGVSFLAIPFVFDFGGTPRIIYLIVGTAVISLVMVTNPDVAGEPQRP
jgi:hypothetical protein